MNMRVLASLMQRALDEIEHLKRRGGMARRREKARALLLACLEIIEEARRAHMSPNGPK